MAVRVLFVAALCVTFLACFLGWKARFLGTYLRSESLFGAGALVLLALLAWGGARLARAGSLAGTALGVPLLAILAVDLMVTPLPYELAVEARGLPHPEGAPAPEVLTSPVFDRAHPIAFATFRYQEGRALADLFEETRVAFESEGWETFGARPPTGEANDYALLSSRSDPFVAHCTLTNDREVGRSPVPTLRCSLKIGKG